MRMVSMILVSAIAVLAAPDSFAGRPEACKREQSCFIALDGRARKACEDDIFPGRHLYWLRCASR